SRGSSRGGGSLHTAAEGVGFEPTGHCCPLVFKTRSIGRSDNPPDRYRIKTAPVEQSSSLTDGTADLLFQECPEEPLSAAACQSERSTAATPPSCTDRVTSDAASRTSCGPCC